MSRKNSLIFLLTFCVLIFSFWGTAWAGSELTALNVAILPPVTTDKYASATDTQVIQNKIARHFRYPYYELVPSDKIYNVLSALEPEFESEKPYSEEILKEISEKLPADIVVIVELAKVRSYVYQQGWWFHDRDYIQETDVILNCYTYSASTGQYHKAQVKWHNIDILSVTSGLDVILPNLTTELLKKIPYKTIPDKQLN